MKDVLVASISAAAVNEAVDRMNQAALPGSVVRNFERLFRQVLEGKTGIIFEDDIEPLSDVPTLGSIEANEEILAEGRRALEQLVVMRLNGGLGTTMGLERAKSLLRVRGDLTFNDIIGCQLRAIKKQTGVAIPLVHMTSFSTDADVKGAMQPFNDLNPPSVPFTFLQHKHPKIYADTMTPAHESDDNLNWNPPGHGDLYAALIATGLAEELLALGKRYVFVANADNLGATVEPSILGYLVSSGAPFLMETAERTEADSKGGHLARSRATGRLILRESGQAPITPSGEVIPEFRDVNRHRHFNTNNIWLDLKAVVKVARDHEGSIPLALISNKKTVNPRDKSSRAVIQIETAMGAAVEVFDGAQVLQVPRARFAPVKSNNDLMVVRSDAYVLTPDFTLTANPERTLPQLPLVSLDPRFFGFLKDFEARVKVVPSLVQAESLSVKGDVVFSHPLKVCGKVAICATGEHQAVIPAALAVADTLEYSL
jgi:UTP--glucose-1-phosphate uridylyltransferase